MDYGLTGKVALVTGSGGGIGHAIARMLVQEGAKVVGADLDPSQLSALGGEDQILPFKVDLSESTGPAAAVDAAVDTFGRLDILVNNVAIAPARDSFLDVSDEDWRHVMDVNFMSMVRACRSAIPVMKSNGGGSIVSIASDEGRQPDVFFADYSVSKAAVLNLTKTLSIEFGPSKIRVNSVSPGPTRTPIWDRPGGFADYLVEFLEAKDRDDAIDKFVREVRRMPIQRIGLPEDVAHAVLFLASDVSRQVTGSDYWVNGGTMISI
ncbi:SDR family oxidoreductase [Sphaerisporangium sp. NPDC088356]|uniref:SDR family NAD(P)-dependent oxidoreductase n=1 Tax=Sphaerisporangium sp. NPDC088356 TaxID=3154871 RepID=UPI003436632B